jgi:ribonuclease HII
MARVNPDTFFESQLWKSGLLHVAGLDEAGRGALAGPVAVGAVILPKNKALRFDDAQRGLSRTLAGVRDSKQMTPLEREALAPRIKATALTWSVGFASAEEIDSQGIVCATRLAALRALDGLSLSPQYLLTDFRLELPQLDISQTALVKGDALCLSIAAASVLAKTARDELMYELDLCYQGYGLGKHKGYGTQSHRSALERLGFSAIHRKSFRVRAGLPRPSSS